MSTVASLGTSLSLLLGANTLSKTTTATTSAKTAATSQAAASSSVSSTATAMTSSQALEDESIDDQTYTANAGHQGGFSVAGATNTSATSVGIGSTSYYSQFMPTRPGFNADALANAVSNPGLETISSGLSSADSASAARASLDSKYAAMAASGQPFDINSPEGKDWYTAFGSLDRNALNAVMTNQGGLFTKQEQNIAQSIMSQQQGLAMGLYSGPSSQASKFVDPFAGQDSSARMKAGAKWLDQVSSDEKKTVAWASSRASAQTSYKNSGSAADDSGNINSDSPLVSLIASAMNTMSSAPSRSYTVGNVTTISDLLAQPWFNGFASQLNGAIARTQNLYS